LAKNGQSHAELGGLKIGDQPGGEAFAQTILELVVVGGRAVARQDQLAAGLVEGVEGVEELLFGLELVGEELDVVDKEHVGSREAACARRMPSPISEWSKV